MHHTTLNMTPKIQTYFENIKKNVCLQIPNDIHKTEALLVLFVCFPQNARQPKAVTSPSTMSHMKSQAHQCALCAHIINSTTFF